MLKSIARLIYNNVCQYRHKIYLEDIKNSMTYGEVEKFANSLANFLIEHGVKAGDRVGILMDNSIYHPIAIYGIMKISAIFVPINSSLSKNGIEKIIFDCTPKILIVSTKCLREKIAEKLCPYLKLLLIGEEPENKVPYPWFKWIDAVNRETPCILPNNDLKNIFYIIYTSGSTGEAKGVSIRQDSLLNFIEDTNNTYQFDDTTKLINLLPFYFDGSLGDIFCSLTCGGYLYIYNEGVLHPGKIIKKIVEKKITDFGCTPGMIELLVHYLSKIKENLDFIKVISVGGDKSNIKLLMKLLEYIPHLKLYNDYGPTECTIVTSRYEIDRNKVSSFEEIPIGKPITNTNFYALNNKGILIKPGEVGELYIGGIQVMEKYWGDKELTQKVLVESPFIKGEVLYKSDDLVTINEEQHYIFVGRNNDLLKRYGYRIYLSEIERNIKALPQVTECVCLKGAENQAVVTAFIRCEPKLDGDHLLASLKKEFPPYMVPDYIINLNTFPYTKTGKIDKKALKKMKMEKVKYNN